MIDVNAFTTEVKNKFLDGSLLSAPTWSAP